MHNLLIESKVIAGENVTVIWIWNRIEDGDFLFQLFLEIGLVQSYHK